MRKKDNNLNRGQVHRNLVYELLPRGGGLFKAFARTIGLGVSTIYYLISACALAIAVVHVRHRRHVRFHHSVTIVTGDFRIVIL
jgi:hypothetical protein